MKKQRILLFCILGLIIIVFTGCNYRRLEEEKLGEIKFYDSNDQEIIGKYVDYSDKNFSRVEEINNLKLNFGTPINIDSYYCANIIPYSTVKVVMKFKSDYNYEVKGIYLSLRNIREESTFSITEMDSVEKIDEYVMITYTMRYITSDYNIGIITHLLDGDNRIREFESGKSNRYIRGFYFYMDEE